jgi:hypothetical protein
MQKPTVFVLVALTGCGPHARRPSAPPPAPTTTTTTSSAAACTEPERRHLDFWLGDWDLVVRSRQDPASPAANAANLANVANVTWVEARAVSEVRAVLGGCAIEENFHADGPQAPWAGRSFSTYVPSAKVWRQTWVDDSGSYLAFTGGRDADGFALYGEPVGADRKRRMRMVFRAITRDSLMWSWERGTDPATEWTPVMTIGYTRRPVAKPGTPCEADPTFHDLDYWLGEWRVTSGGKEVGTNRIAKIMGGCAIVEEWKDADGSEGRSLFFHPPGSSNWRQVWLTPAATSLGGSKEKELVSREPGGLLRFQGELRSAARPGSVLLDRTTLTPLSGGRVHQVIEISRDVGAHWETTFDGTYERK